MRLHGWIEIGEKLKGLKLNVKFTLMTILFFIIPAAVFSIFLFWNIEKNTVEEQIKSMEYRLERSQDQIQKNADAINMSTQFFLNDQALKDFLINIKTGKQMSTEEVTEFCHRDIAAMERMVNSNLYLYQIRVYVNEDRVQEMMPILYSRNRMKRLSWADDELLYGWKFDYVDTIFDSYTINQKHKIMSIVTPIEDYEYGELAVLEVAMGMETMFDGLYNDEDGITCFLDELGKQYFGSGEDRENNCMKEVLDRIIWEDGQKNVYYDTIKGEEVIVGCMPVKALNGRLICVRSISEEIGGVRHMRNVFIFFMMLLLPVMALIINLMVKSMLRQFYEILKAVKKVQTGDLDVVIENCRTDEMGELGRQMNKMLAEIKRLMSDNLNRELLIKNSEIKALQNQINAHFIYNVLESIKMMAEIEEKYDISDAITTLGKLLRYSMKWTNSNVTVGEEIEYIKNYLALINLRFDYEIYLSLNIPDIIYRQKIPKMSLQPIVENAIYHGIEQMAEDTSIYMKGLIDGEDCIIEITDAGRGMTEEEVTQLYKKIAGEIETTGGSGNGIGLKNVQDRIKMSFGEAYGIGIASKLGCYTKITVKIPLQRGQ